MGAADLFRTATLLPTNDGSPQKGGSVSDALAPALSGEAVIRGLSFEYVMPGGERRVLELMVSPVTADDASMLGATVALTDKTELARLRQDQDAAREIAAEMALGLRNSLTAIAGYAQQLARSRDSELSRQLADDIAHETAQLDRTVGSFLAGARSAAAGS
jgi:nitrogen-specific signal transduction histidine kinase